MFRDYNPAETRLEYVHRKEQGDRHFARLVAKDKASRRKRVKRNRARQARKETHYAHRS